MMRILIILYTLGATCAWGAFPNGWTRRAKLAVAHTSVPANQTAFPVLITQASLPSEMLALGGPNAAQADGGDIRLSADAAGATPLPAEITLWQQNANPSLAKAEIWAPLTISSMWDTEFYVWYKAGGGQTQPPATDAYGAQAVWGTNYKSVFHLPDGSSLALTDSTGTTTLSNTNTVTATAGQIDGAGSFNGTSQSLDATTAPLTAVPLTLEAWVKPTALTANGPTDGIVLSVLNSGAWAGWYIHWSGSTFKATATSNSSFTASVSAPASLNTWYHVAGVFASDSSRTIYVNGVAATADSTTKPPSFTPNRTHIGLGFFGGGNWFPGAIDEVRISNVARSSDWIATEYNNQSSPATFVVLASTPSAANGPRRRILQ
jgi:hypothetical protein